MSSTPISRAEPVVSERAQRVDRSAPARGPERRDARADFENALQRADRSPSQPRALQEEAEEPAFGGTSASGAAGAAPGAALPALQDGPPALLRPTVAAPAWAPRAPAPVDAVSAYLNALQSTPGNPSVPGQWKLQLLDASLPVQQLDIRRGSAGGLRVALGASAETARSAPLERLRQRLAARGNAPESLACGPAEELEP